MKKVLTLALVALMSCGAVVYAQTPTTDATTQTCPGKECKKSDCKKKDCKKKDCKKADCKKAECKKGDFKKAPRECNPFEGLNLTADQQKQLDALRANCCKKDDANNAEACKVKACPAEKKKEMLAKVKAILTPEQYVQFLENSFVNAGPGRKGAPDMRKNRPDSSARMCQQGKKDCPKKK